MGDLALLIGYFGFGNAGDDWILDAVSGKVVPSAVPAGPAKLPERVQRRGRFAGQLAISRARAVVLAGGELFQTRTSRRSLFYYLTACYLARLFRRPLFAIGIALDPSLPPWACRLTASALKRGDIWVRDSATQVVLGRHGAVSRLAPDSVWTLIRKPASPAAALRRILWILRPGSSEDWESRLVQWRNLAESTGWEMGILALQPQDVPNLAQLRARLPFFHRLESWQDREEIFSVLARYDLVVSMRYHGLIAAALAGRAAAALSDHPKVEALARDLGMPILAAGTPWRAPLQAAFERGPVDPQPLARQAQQAIDELARKNVK